MARLPLDQGIPRFKANEERIDLMTNGDENATWRTADGTDVPSVRKMFKDINTAGEGWLALAGEEADRAETAAIAAALYDGPWVHDVDSLKANTSMTLTPGQAGTVTRGQIVRTRKEGYAYLIPLAGNGHRQTAGGVPLEYMPNSVAYAAALWPDASSQTDCTYVITILEASGASTVDLGGVDLPVRLFWEAADGLDLRKNYINGRIISGGVKRVVNFADGAAQAPAVLATFASPATWKKMGVRRNSANSYEIFRPLGGNIWQRYEVGRSGAGIPQNWREDWLTRFLGYQTVDDVGFTMDGTWTSVNSASASLHVNGRSRQAGWTPASPPSPMPYIEFEWDGDGDLYLLYTGRTSGTYAEVTINGSADLVSLPINAAGKAWFDSYTPVDNQYKQAVKIASSLARGTYTVRVTPMNERNPAASGATYNFQVNCLAFDGPSFGPWDRRASAKTWASGEAVYLNQERQYNGRWYRATEDGTTGGTPPTHTSGSVSDGGVTWAYRTADPTASSYGQVRQRLQGPGSQVEYAYNILPEGATTREDVGGAAHGNEVQTAEQWYVDGAPVTMSDGQWLTGEKIEIREAIDAVHSEINSGNTPIVSTVLRRSFDVKTGVTIWHDHTFLHDASVGWFYSGMRPFVHYNNASGAYKNAVDRWDVPGYGPVNATDWYYNPADPPYYHNAVVQTKDLLAVASGYALLPDGTSASPSRGSTLIRFKSWMATTPESVEDYKHSRTHFSIEVNTSDRDPLSDPNQSMIMKGRFMRYDGIRPVEKKAGDHITNRVIYGLIIEAA
ncbi:hypothetical protein [Aquamicrobium zhengzhouense]|uniref:Minor tail protein n=1 Tax=Aquamicrobium zhengzhouense TaxID=2781738 RepID=A0ABS0SC08_9HYPH|nr:hypothetical protein [Aquamicrobium zhengzhouense]MBI1620027.1 hypothetical protein [Aquamicrobium zhengzhouense]